ncbi:hypothetical protein FOC1_g10000457, partial [Fusarium oxysporum f. sp. cubense race 1]
AINQIDVNAQVVAEPSRSGGQGRSARPRERRYRICRKPGYNIRTYQVVIKTSREEYSN